MTPQYMAGFFDGEGCVGFCRVRQSIYPRVLVTNTNLEILEEFRSQFGGGVWPLSKRKAGWKQGYSWRISWSSAVKFLAVIQPYVHLKCRQVETVFAWDAIRLGRGKPSASRREEYDDAVSFLIERMTWLNKRGPIEGIDPAEEIAAIAMSEARKSKS
jgi:hypothetical protein